MSMARRRVSTKGTSSTSGRINSTLTTYSECSLAGAELRCSSEVLANTDTTSMGEAIWDSAIIISSNREVTSLRRTLQFTCFSSSYHCSLFFSWLECSTLGAVGVLTSTISTFPTRQITCTQSKQSHNASKSLTSSQSDRPSTSGPTKFSNKR